MPRTRTKAGVGLLMASLAMLAASCSSSMSSSKHLVVYSGQHPQTSAALVAAFERSTGIRVTVRSSDEAVLANQIKIEGSRSPADVFYAENSAPLESVASRGLLTTLPASVLDRVPARFSSPKGAWVGVTARFSVMAYSTTHLKPSQLPSSILELAQPKWKGKIGIAPAETDFQPLVASVVQRYGATKTLHWLEGLKANAGSHIYPSNEDLLAAIDRGDVELGVINQYYWYRQAQQIGARSMHSALATFAPGDAGFIESTSGAGVLAASHDKAAAERFVAFLVSAQGQAIIARSSSFEYPLAAGIATPTGEPALSTLRPSPFTVAELGDGAIALALLQQAQLL